MNLRRDALLKYLNSLNLGKKISILELGYWAGQNAKYFIKQCKKFYGIGVSAPLAKFARKKIKASVKSGNYSIFKLLKVNFFLYCSKSERIMFNKWTN